MKNKLIAIVLILMLTASYVTADIVRTNMVHGYNTSNMTGTLKQDEIRLVSIITPVRQGSVCSMIIQGKPGITYTAVCTYMLQGTPHTDVATKTAGGDGIATWTWVVRPATTPGTYQITVSGGGQTLDTSYTVIK